MDYGDNPEASGSGGHCPKMTVVFDAYLLFPFRPASLHHFGEWSLEDSSLIIHSDTLFSAFVNVSALLFGNRGPSTLIQAAQDGAFRLSSAFPCIKVVRNSGSTTHFFFPRPRIRFARALGESEPLSKKELKKMRFLSQGLFQKLLTQTLPEDGQPLAVTNLEEEAKRLFTDFYLLKDEPLAGRNFTGSASPFVTIVSPKVTLDRLTSVSEFWDQTDLLLTEMGLRDGVRILPGFFFMMSKVADDLRNLLEGSLCLLIDEGIGGKRSSGRGLFASFERSRISFDLPENGRFAVNLSTLLPERDEVDRLITYDFIKRGGFVYSGAGTALPKPVVRMLSEGSVHSGVPRGRLYQVPLPASNPPGHPVFKYGLAFPVPFGGPL